MTRIFTIASLALAALPIFSLVTPASAQNLITNPGFEDGTTGWALTGNGGSNSYSNYSMTPTASFGTTLLAFNGGQLAPNAVLSQSFITTPGSSYSVSFVYGNYYNLSGTATQSITAAAVNTANSAVLNSAIATDTVTGNQDAFSTVTDTAYVFTFTATGINTTLRFTDSPSSTTTNSDGILDNVSVVAVVPEAGSLVLILPALALVGAVVARRTIRRKMASEIILKGTGKSGGTAHPMQVIVRFLLSNRRTRLERNVLMRPSIVYATTSIGVACACAAVCLSSTAALAQTPALIDFTGGEYYFAISGTEQTIGWRFTANDNLSVTQLGLLDTSPSNGLRSPTEVGIWTDTGTLISSLTVAANSPLTNNFRYAPVAVPFVLNSGQTYRIGMRNILSSADNQFVIRTSSFSMNPNVSWNSAVINSGSGFTFPGITQNYNGGIWGPNFQFVTVPEAGSLALVLPAIGLLCAVLVRRRK